jgi:rhodanese-related sulfurtransferase
MASPKQHVHDDLAIRIGVLALNGVSQIPAAAPDTAQKYFATRLSLETDCADVHEALTEVAHKTADFVLFDVRSPQAYARSHVPGAINVPHRTINAERLKDWPIDTLFVVYCAGPHCNGADRAALRLADLKRPVKLMLGGMTGWSDEGFAIAKGDAPGSLSKAPKSAPAK